MREITLELTDRMGDPVFASCTADGLIAFDWWYLSPRHERHFEPYLRSTWQGYTLLCHLVPIIEATFATLKETTDEQHPRPEP